MGEKEQVKSQLLHSQLLEPGEAAWPSLALTGWDVQWGLNQRQGSLELYFYIKTLLCGMNYLVKSVN